MPDQPLSTVLSARSRFTATRQHRGPDDPATVKAGRDLGAVKIAEYVRRTVAELGPPTDEQAQRIAALLRPVPQDGRAAG